LSVGIIEIKLQQFQLKLQNYNHYSSTEIVVGRKQEAAKNNCSGRSQRVNIMNNILLPMQTPRISSSATESM
jgi:hypothetical protein